MPGEAKISWDDECKQPKKKAMSGGERREITHSRTIDGTRPFDIGSSWTMP